MNRKEILKNSRLNFMRYFWIYISAAAILFVAAAADGYADVIIGVRNLIFSIRNGIFDAEQIMDMNSELWTVMLSGREIGAWGIVISVFIANPLNVGFAGLFLQGTDTTPKIKTFFDVFKKKYMNIVGVTTLSEIVIEILTVVMSLVYIFALSMPIGVISVAASVEKRNVFIAACILSVLAVVGITSLYLVWIMSMRYNFYFVPYILSKNPSFKFSAAYVTSKRLVHGKKLEIFKTEFWVLFGKALSITVPYMLFAVGFFITLYGKSGLDFIFAAILLLVPCACFGIYLSARRETIRANIYQKHG